MGADKFFVSRGVLNRHNLRKFNIPQRFLGRGLGFIFQRTKLFFMEDSLPEN